MSQVVTSSNGFLTTYVYSPIDYNEIKYVCLTYIQSIPTDDNYKEIIPHATEENLKNPNILIPLEHKGGPEFGNTIIADTELSYGIEYELDENGQPILDELGSPVISVNNGVLFHLETSGDLADKRFNAIIAYSNEIDPITGSYAIALVTFFSNALSLKKILNFCARYIINVELQVVKVEIDYWPPYETHIKNVSSTPAYFRKIHPNVSKTLMTTDLKINDQDALDEMVKGYKTKFLNAETLYIAPKDHFDPLEEVPTYEIQYLKNLKVNRYYDKVIRSDYIYYYLNIYASRLLLTTAIVEDDENLETIEDFNSVTHKTLRQHLKLGFNEVNGSFLYTWMSTPKFIYVFIFNSNSNNNIDLYRVKNIKGVDINDTKFNLVVGKYLDRIYFTINGLLHVCLPQTKTKTMSEEPINKNLIDEANKTYKRIPPILLGIQDDLPAGLELDNVFNTLVEDMKKPSTEPSKMYFLSEEQFCVALISYSLSEEHRQHIVDGKYVPGTSASQTAKDYVANELKGYDLIESNSKQKALLEIKIPLDKIKTFIKRYDELVEDAYNYEQTNSALKYTSKIVKQACDGLTKLLKPDYIVADNYKQAWQGNEGISGVKNDVIIYYIKNGTNQADDPAKYEDYVKKIAEIAPLYFLADEFLNNQTNNTYLAAYPKGVTAPYYENVGMKIKAHHPDMTSTLGKTIYFDYLKEPLYHEKDIFEILRIFMKYWDHCQYLGYYDSNINLTKDLDTFCLRQYLLEGKTDLNEIDTIKSMTSFEIITKVNDEKVNPLKNTMNAADWWDEGSMAQLNEFYKKISLIECSVEYPYNTVDTFYYNGVKQENKPLDERLQGIPFRYGFPYPNYIYSSNCDKFIIPEHPKFDMTGEYPSKVKMEEELLVPISNGTVEDKAGLDELLKIVPTITVETIGDRNALVYVTGAYENETKLNEAILFEGAFQTLDDCLNNNPSEGKVYYIIEDDSYYKYEKGALTLNTSFPIVNKIYEIKGTYSFKKLKRGDGPNYALSWERYSMPSQSDIILINEANIYFKYVGTPGYKDPNDVEPPNPDQPIEDTDWKEITEASVKAELTGKIYLVSNTNEYYKFNGTAWDRVAPTYDIKVNSFYKVTNKPEEITEYISEDNITSEADSDNWVITFTNTSNNEHTLTLNNLTPNDPDAEKVAYSITQDGQEINKGELEIEKENPDTPIQKIYEIKFKPAKNNKIITITLTNAKINGVFISYVWVRQPGATGDQYFMWNGLNLQEVQLGSVELPLIPEQQSSKFVLGDAYYNIYLEGDKLNVIRDLFKSKEGEPLEVIQFDFSDIGDVVLVKNYDGLGSNGWGGVFSRKRLENDKGVPLLDWGVDVVISDDVKQAINWESYSNLLWNEWEYKDGKYNEKKGFPNISDARADRIVSLYEISRMHYENLKMHFGEENMRFSNALTICFQENANGTKSMCLFPKNLKMITNYYITRYNDTRMDINNYTVILSEVWLDTIFRRFIYMNSAVGSDYNDIFITANRGVCVVAVTPRNQQNGLEEGKEPEAMNGAYTYFDVNTWYNQAQVLDNLDPNRIPNKDL